MGYKRSCKIFKEKLLKNFLTIDPGNYTGYAYFINNKLSVSGSFTFDKKIKGMSKQFEHLNSCFTGLLNSLEPEKVFIEDLQLYGNSSKSLISGLSGDLFKVAKVTGLYVSQCLIRNIPFEYLKPNKWKGQMNKQIVENRVKRVYPKLRFSNDHEMDAVGIGLHITGEL